jgi:hypothetical protein
MKEMERDVKVISQDIWTSECKQQGHNDVWVQLCASLSESASQDWEDQRLGQIGVIVHQGPQGPQTESKLAFRFPIYFYMLAYGTLSIALIYCLIGTYL